MNNKRDFKFFLRIGGSLLLISTLIALMLAFVNNQTSNKIQNNKNIEMNKTISVIFEGDVNTKSLDTEVAEPVKTIYEVHSNDNLVGYAVYVTPTGFKAPIEMMVGINLDGSCKAVKVISLSETPGLGSKVAEGNYLKQYTGKGSEIELKTDIDAVAGATISSKAVLTGVNSAIAAVSDIIQGG